MPTSFTDGKDTPKEERSYLDGVTDVYISVFFDGTGNNLYEQVHKANTLKEKNYIVSMVNASESYYSYSPDMFKSKASELYDKLHEGRTRAQTKEEKAMDEKMYGMSDYELQRRQAEYEYKIEDSKTDNRTSQDDPDNMGGWKYSNIAVLRSLTKKPIGDSKVDEKNIKGINYNLYIEGSGQKWGEGSDVVALGMGTGREGVVGLVSKAVVFVQNFVDSVVSPINRKNVNLHFAVFGFSRGATCGRLFSFLLAANPNILPRKNEFKQYLPKSILGNDGYFHFLDDYSKTNDNNNRVFVDFLGIYDTVSSIGFLQKDDNSTNYGINRYYECPKEDEKYLHFDTTKDNKKTKWYINILHGSKLKNGEPAIYDTPQGPVPNWNAIEQVATDNLWGDAKWNFHRFNAHDYGLYSPLLDNVKHTYHICAMDEFRENFALVDLGSEICSHCTEIFMPGCHSDIGGGFMYNDELEKYTLRLRINKKNTLINKNPDPRILGTFNKDIVPLSQNSLFEMGWLTEMTGMGKMFYGGPEVKKTKFKNPFKEDISYNTEGRTTYIYDDDKKIEFERFVKEGYSNITLDMMKEKTIDTLQNKMEWPERFIPFHNSTLPKRFEVPEDLKCILEMAKNKSKKEGDRTFVLPKETIYQMLRREYLHFSCTDELNVEHLHFRAAGANIGNPPNWRKRDEYNGYLLCRLIYRGDEYDPNLYYMNDYQ